MFTLKKFMDYINSALNYPAVSEQDIALFLDQAISEVNTEAHISIPDLDKMKKEQSDLPANTKLITLQTADFEITFPKYATENEAIADNTPTYYFNTISRTFGVYNEDLHKYEYFIRLFGLYKDPLNPINNTYVEARTTYTDQINVNWYNLSYEALFTVDLEYYFTPDWIKLFLIPYVCHKYSVRDGDTGRLFSEEFSQGFQQLKNSYNIPFTVHLKDVADKPAYRKLVLEKLPNLDVICKTRAITEDMFNAQGVNANKLDFYDNGGGFGL